MSLAKKFKNSRGFTLVELMIVVVIIGILAALAIYGVRQYVTNAKTGEARAALGRLAKDAAAAFEAERMDGGVMGLGTTRGVSRRLCADAAPVPTNLQGAGEKYQPKAADWITDGDDANDKGWTCLKFSMDQPIYFQYNYTSIGENPAPAEPEQTFTGSAVANFGGTYKVMTLGGEIVTDSDTGTLVLAVAPAISESETTEAPGAAPAAPGGSGD